MFKALDNWGILQLLRSIQDKKLGIIPDVGISEGALYNEVCTHEKRMSSVSHLNKLNRLDLVSLLYAMLYHEIKEIDSCPKDDLPTLMNKEWSCTQLHDRLLSRMRGDKV